MSGVVRGESMDEAAVGFILRRSSTRRSSMASRRSSMASRRSSIAGECRRLSSASAPEGVPLPTRPERTKGLMFALLAVLAISPDAMLLRSMVAIGATPVDAALAKYTGVVLFMLGFGFAKGARGLFVSKRHLVAAIVLQSITQFGFAFSFLFAEPARALLLISLTPLWVELLGVYFIGDPLPNHTVVAMGCAVLSIGIVVAPQLISGLLGGTTPSDGDLSHVGDLFAIVTSLSQASVLTVWRHAAIHAPESDLVLVSGIAAFVSGMICLHLPCGGNFPVTNDFLYVCSPKLWHSAAFLILAVFDALACIFYMVGQTKAPRYISAGEVALIGLLEDVLGPIWVYVRFGTAPSPWTIAGGAMLLATLVIHELAGMRAESEEEDAMLPMQTKQTAVDIT